MKKFILALILTVIYFCVGVKPVQLIDRAIIQSIGIDYENGEYITTLLYYNPGSSSGEDATKTDASNSVMVTGSGPSLADALSAVSLKTGKKNFYGHNNIVIVGKEAAESKLENIFTYFNGNPDLIANFDLLIAAGAAREIMEIKTDEKTMPTISMLEIIDNARTNGTAPKDKYINIVKSYLSKNEDPIIPHIQVNSDQNGQSFYIVSGGSVISDGKYAGDIDGDEMLGINLLVGNVEGFSQTVSLGEDRYATLKLYNSSSDIDVEDKRANVKMKGIITDIYPITDSVGPQMMADIKSAAEEKINEICKNAIKKVTLQYNSNIIGTQRLSADYTVSTRINIEESGMFSINA